jgi:hypothetical protein
LRQKKVEGVKFEEVGSLKGKGCYKKTVSRGENAAVGTDFGSV